MSTNLSLINHRNHLLSGYDKNIVPMKVFSTYEFKCASARIPVPIKSFQKGGQKENLVPNAIMQLSIKIKVLNRAILLLSHDSLLFRTSPTILWMLPLVLPSSISTVLKRHINININLIKIFIIKINIIKVSYVKFDSFASRGS